jgi:hypothetical protein
VQQDVYVLDDQFKGPALFKSSTDFRLYTFEVIAQRPTKRKARPVAFHQENSASIISGSDHGKVYVFERRSQKQFDILDSGYTHRIQALTVSFCCSFHFSIS